MKPQLEINNLCKSFGGLVATNGISFSIAAGESVGIIGPNGAGKTTIFNLLTNEIRPDSGTIKLNGRNIGSKSTHQRVRMGLVRTYQIPRPFSGLTLRDNIRISMLPDNLWDMLRNGPDRAFEQTTAESVGLHKEQMNCFPSELAMGDLRKLELARALITNPGILLLDEVFAGLTYGEITQISTLLRERNASHGTTYLIVSHDLKSLAALVGRVIVINFGEILAEGLFDTVLEKQAVQEAYFGSATQSVSAGEAQS